MRISSSDFAKELPLYLVQWEGYSEEWDLWMHELDLPYVLLHPERVILIINKECKRSR